MVACLAAPHLLGVLVVHCATIDDVPPPLPAAAVEGQLAEALCTLLATKPCLSLSDKPRVRSQMPWDVAALMMSSALDWLTATWPSSFKYLDLVTFCCWDSVKQCLISWQISSVTHPLCRSHQYTCAPGHRTNAATCYLMSSTTLKKIL